MGLSDINLTVQTLVFRVLAIMLLVTVQGCAVAAAALLLGDRGPRHDGRINLWPGGHLDMAGAFCLVLFDQGWGRPVDVDARTLRTGRAGMVLVVLAGAAAVLGLALALQALVLPALTALPHSAALTTAAFLRSTADLAIGFALFNLLPVPPLTGGLLLRAAGMSVPPRAVWVLAAALIVASATGVVRQVTAPAHMALSSALFGR